MAHPFPRNFEPFALQDHSALIILVNDVIDCWNQQNWLSKTPENPELIYLVSVNDSQLPELLPTQLDYTASGRTIRPALIQTIKYV